MKLAISIQASESNAPVDPRFGRARFFRIVDIETGQQMTLDNAEGVNAAQGAGAQAAQSLARLGVQTVLTGHVGPKAQNALQAAGIQAYAAAGGTAEQAVRDFMDGRLQVLTGADVRGHW